MFYTIFWIIMWLLLGKTTFTFGTGTEFWALIVAVLADVLYVGWGRKWINRP